MGAQVFSSGEQLSRSGGEAGRECGRLPFSLPGRFAAFLDYFFPFFLASRYSNSWFSWFCSGLFGLITPRSRLIFRAIDEREQERLDILHVAYTLHFNGRLFHAPINPDGDFHAVDIGTGTGIWAVDFADQYPNATVEGWDISPM